MIHVAAVDLSLPLSCCVSSTSQGALRPIMWLGWGLLVGQLNPGLTWNDVTIRPLGYLQLGSPNAMGGGGLEEETPSGRG